MQIQISWLLQKATDLDLHCLQGQVVPGFSRTRVKMNLYHISTNEVVINDIVMLNFTPLSTFSLRAALLRRTSAKFYHDLIQTFCCNYLYTKILFYSMIFKR